MSASAKSCAFTNKKLTPTFNYRINNTDLEWVTVFKYLGLLIDNKLKWNDQTNQKKPPSLIENSEIKSIFSLGQATP